MNPARAGRRILEAMRRTPLARLLSAVLALWFALGLLESAALHVCPMHDGTVARATDAPVPAPHPADGVPHGGSSHGDHATLPATPGHDDSHACSCLGECGLAVAVAAPAVRITGVPAVVADGRPPVLRSRVTTRSASSHVLPPATAPPAARVG